MTYTRLLDAIDALTKPTIDNVKQTTDDGEYLRTVPVEHPPLLQQLADAVVPSAGNDGGSKSASARERNVIDSDALWELTKVQHQLLGWCQVLHIEAARFAGTRVPDLPATLRRWYAAWIGLPHSQPAEDWYLRELRRWERIILAKLDRNVKQIPTGYLCVICKTATWIDPDGERQPARLILSYRRDEDGRTSEEQVTCQRCRTRWDSMGAIEELGEELAEVSERVSA